MRVQPESYPLARALAQSALEPYTKNQTVPLHQPTCNVDAEFVAATSRQICVTSVSLAFANSELVRYMPSLRLHVLFKLCQLRSVQSSTSGRLQQRRLVRLHLLRVPADIRIPDPWVVFSGPQRPSLSSRRRWHCCATAVSQSGSLDTRRMVGVDTVA